ncbi:MAG: murein L,D-transpeptidase catalytic domain family protein [Gammaproteobacteria bacterium]
MRRLVVSAVLGLVTFAVYAFVPDNRTDVGPITIITPSTDFPLDKESADSPALTTFTEEEMRQILEALSIGEEIELLEEIPSLDDPDALAEIEAIEKLNLDDMALEALDEPLEVTEEPRVKEADEPAETAHATETPDARKTAQAPETAGFRSIAATVETSIYDAAVKAGLSSQQVVRLTKLLKPHIDFSRELRKGDELRITLDPEAGNAPDDANRLHRIEFTGARKQLVVTRKADSLDDYEVSDAEGKPVAVAQEKAVKKPATNKAQSKPEVASAAKARTTKKASSGNDGRRLEATIDFSLFSAARQAGLTTQQTVKLRSILDPYIDYNKELRKGDRLVIKMDKKGSTIDSIEYKGKKKQLLAVREENGDYAITDHTDGTIKVARKKASTKAVAKVEKRSRKSTSRPVISGWKPRDKSLARVYARLLQSGKVNKQALQKAFKYYENNRYTRELSDRHMAIADYTQTALTRRLHIIDLKSGNVKSYQVAHGRRSGPVGGRVHTVSNVVGSNKTSKGFFKVGFKEGRTRTKGYHYLPIEGLESANRKVGLPTRLGGRDVIVHTASYVESGGRSNGCFAIRPQDKRQVFSKLKGALLYSYAG